MTSKTEIFSLSPSPSLSPNNENLTSNNDPCTAICCEVIVNNCLCDVLCHFCDIFLKCLTLDSDED